MTEEIHRRTVADIPDLRGDDRILSLLGASIDENVAACLHLLQLEFNVDRIQAPSAALEYTRRLAQHGVRISALLRAYRVGHEMFLAFCLDELARLITDVDELASATLRMTRIVFSYVDRVSEQVVAAYEVEQRLWLQNRAAVRASSIRSLLSNQQDDGAVVKKRSATGSPSGTSASSCGSAAAPPRGKTWSGSKSSVSGSGASSAAPRIHCLYPTMM
jgi:hypothetical protein